MSASARRTLGAIVFLVALSFLAVQLYDQRQHLRGFGLDPRIWSAILAFSLVYALSLVPVSIAWGLCLGNGDVPNLRWTRVVGVWGTANLYKYLPGNVFHFAGRQLMGRELGWPQAAILTATIAEIALHVVITTVFVLLLLNVAIFRIAAITPAGPTGIAAGIALALVALVAVAVVRKKGLIGLMALMPRPRSLAIAACLQASFFAVIAILAVCMGRNIDLSDGIEADAILAGGFLLAWLIGFVVPGAPGGLAVREAALLLIAGTLGIENEAGILALAISMRVVTTLGDVGLGLAAMLISRRGGEPPPRDPVSRT